MSVKVSEEGFLTYEDTIFFKGGVFEYAGCEIDPDGSHFGLSPNTLYKVYRPDSEVTNPEFIQSLNAKPIVDDHTLIGNKAGFEKPERKNCAGVLTDVKAVGNELHGRVDIWSTKMIDKIRQGKRELSLAYCCNYERSRGVHEGQRYDFVQSKLRAGNHLALVDEARNGHDCRVVDCAYSCDAKFQLEKPNMDWKNISADELVNGLKECSDECKAKAKEFLNTPTADELAAKQAQEKAEAEKKAAEDKERADKAEAEKAEAVKKAVDECKEQAAKDAEEAKNKAEEEKKTACDKAVAEYKKAVSLANDCKAKFGNISMDGISTELDLAKKVCAMDKAPSFLKSVKESEAIVALKGYLSASVTSRTVLDSKPSDGAMSVADYLKSR